MKGIREVIIEHNHFIEKNYEDDNFIERHNYMLDILKHERFMHLVVTMFTTLFTFIMLGLLLYFQTIPILSIFIILLVLDGFYIMYYFELENTTIKWEIIGLERIIAKEEKIS